MAKNDKIIAELSQQGLEVNVEKIEGSSTTSKVIVNGEVILNSAVVPRVQGFLEGLMYVAKLNK